MTILEPFSANFSARDFPIPEDAPVITTTLFFICTIFSAPKSIKTTGKLNFDNFDNTNFYIVGERDIFYRHLGLPSRNPIGLEIKDARGIFLYDKNGKDYIDLVSGVSVSNTGHGHPEIVQAVKDQAATYMHLMVYGEFIQSPQVKLAEKLISHLPSGLDAVYFVNSGSEAIEGALKLAKRFTGRSEIVAFKNAYHGGSHGALSVLGNESLKRAFRPLLPQIRHLNFNNRNQLQEITGQTACVVAETVQAEAGIILPDQDFLKNLRNRCSETGTLLIIDDIQMGMGRSGKLFSFEKYGIVPDILALAKAFGGGMPLGGFISSNKIMNSLTSSPELGHITTFGGHPVSCAAGLTALEIITRNNLPHLAENAGTIFKEALQYHPVIKEIRQCGLMLGIDFSEKVDPQKLLRSFIKNGLITDFFLFREHAFRIAPPLTISKDEIEITIERIKSALNSLKC
ncbi:MAG: aspartate aminotransferase family protein [Bacteroidales bacterium]|nr:aspartate aminotransferase family protein [Bacteroidales bacterium]